MSVTPLHPTVSSTKIIHDPTVDGEYLINIGGVIQLAKEGETPQARRLYRLFLAEYRAREGHPITADEREFQAVQAAFARMGVTMAEPQTAGSKVPV